MSERHPPPRSRAHRPRSQGRHRHLLGAVAVSLLAGAPTALTVGCTGQIGTATGASSGPPSAPPPGPTPADMTAKAKNPDLFTVAMSYFPGQVTAGAPKRLSRLTRTQLDLT